MCVCVCDAVFLFQVKAVFLIKMKPIALSVILYANNK